MRSHPLTFRDDRPYSVLIYTVAADRIVAIDIIRDRGRVHRIAADIGDTTA